MRIAIATDQDYVSSCFGCSQACTILDLEGGSIRRTFVVPNPGWPHRYWADLLERNSVDCLIVGKIGDDAMATIKWRGVRVIPGIQGRINDVVQKYLSDELAPGEAGCGGRPPGSSTPECPFSKSP